MHPMEAFRIRQRLPYQGSWRAQDVHKRQVLDLPTPELQEQAAQIIADHELNVRQAEALCKKLAKPPKEPCLLYTSEGRFRRGGAGCSPRCHPEAGRRV